MEETQSWVLGRAGEEGGLGGGVSEPARWLLGHTHAHVPSVLAPGAQTWAVCCCVLRGPGDRGVTDPPVPALRPTGLHPSPGVHRHPGASQENSGGLLAAGVGAAGPHHRHADRGHGEWAGEHTCTFRRGRQVAPVLLEGAARESGRRASGRSEVSQARGGWREVGLGQNRVLKVSAQLLFPCWLLLWL